MDLEVQKYLRSGKTFNDLEKDLAIKVYRHPILPLVGLKYNQVNSPKGNKIVKECRGLVLEDYTFQCIGKPFFRFFNFGEDIKNCLFDWSDFTTTTKEDGSLQILYHYNGHWHVNTSGSFGLAECNFSGKTWRELFWETSSIDQNKLDPSLTYIFEMWTPYNKVLRVYPTSFVSLLGAFYNPNCLELSEEVVDKLAGEIKVERPERHHFTSAADINSFLQERSQTDKTFEGVVVRDRNNERLKLKSETYVALHHLNDNQNIYNPKRLVPIVLAGETSEILTYFPDVKDELRKVEEKLSEEFSLLLEIWEKYGTIKEQKEFAGYALKSKFSNILFEVRKNPNLTIGEAWSNSADLIVKKLYS